MQSALRDKEDQIASLAAFRDDMLNVSEDERRVAFEWLAEVKATLDRLGGIGLDKADLQNPSEARSTTAPIQLKDKHPFSVAQIPAREQAYANVRFYWPDIIVEDYAYGEGLMLQLRSAISYINEVWAIEACSHFT